MTKVCTLLLLLFFSLAPAMVSAQSPLEIYVVNYPLAYFAERIGGEHVHVVFPAPAEIDPAFWVPTDAVVKAYQKADLIVLNGAGYAKWLQHVSLPMLRTIDSSRQFREDLIESKSTVTHSHGPGGEHSHTGTAFTTWLDFSQAALQAEAIYRALARKDPANRERYLENFSALESDLLQLDQRMSTACSKGDGVPLLGSHPIYQYLARRYQLDIEMMMWEPNEEPGGQEWQKLATLLQTHRAQSMLWEDVPRAESSRQLSELEVQSLVFSPCFARPRDGDFLSVMNSNVDAIEKLFDKASE